MKNKGFTLVEMLVASFIFSLLGIGMISLMRQGNKIWQDQESVKSAYGKAVNVLNQIATDIQSINTDANGGGRLVIARDPIGRTILVFTKHLRPDIEDPILRDSGVVNSYLDPDDNPWSNEPDENSGDGHAYFPNSAGIQLLPSSGTGEVAYIFSPYPRMKIRLHSGDEYEGERVPNPNEAGTVDYFEDDNIALKITSGRRQGIMVLKREWIAWQKYFGYPLYRGFVAPAGMPTDDNVPGSGSLFNDFVSQNTHVSNWMKDVRSIVDQLPDNGIYDVGELSTWLYDFVPAMDLKYVSFADAIIYMGVQIWHDEEESWQPFNFAENSTSNPLALIYDSNTHGFPSALRITVTAMSTQGTLNMTTLASEISSSDDTIQLTNANLLPTETDGYRFVLIGNEWVYFTQSNGNTLESCYRGTRGTFPASHPAGTPVYWGKTLQKIIPLQK